MNNINGVTNNLNSLFQVAEQKANKNSEINKNIVANAMVGQLSTAKDAATVGVVLDLFAEVLKDENHKPEKDTVKSVIKKHHPELFKKGNKDRSQVLKKINETLIEWKDNIESMKVIDLTGRAKSR